MKSNCTTPCSSSTRVPTRSFRSRCAPMARDMRTSVSYRMASAGAARTSKSSFTVGLHGIKQISVHLMPSGVQLIHLAESERDVCRGDHPLHSSAKSIEPTALLKLHSSYHNGSYNQLQQPNAVARGTSIR